MHARSEREGGAESSFVSTGRLPPPELVGALVAEAHDRYEGNTEGETSRVYRNRSSAGELERRGRIYCEPSEALRGQLAARFLSRRLGLDLFASKPAG